MTRTIAEELRDEGKVEGALHTCQRILIKLLRLRFGRVPRVMEQTIRTTADVEQLDSWIAAVITAQSLENIGIPTASKLKHS